MDLNAGEDIVIVFQPFMRMVYDSIFPGKKLADKPKPLHVQSLLELLYSE